MDAVTALGLASCLVGLPLAFSGKLPVAYVTAFVIALVVAGVRSVNAAARGQATLPRALVLGVGALLLVGAAQLIPWGSDPLSVRPGWPPKEPELLASLARNATGTSATLSYDRGRTFCALIVGGLYLLTALLAVPLGRRPSWVRGALLLLVGLAAVETLYGLVEVFAGRGEVFGRLRPTAAGRAAGTFINPIHFASWLAMAIPAALGLALRSPQGRPLPRPWGPKLAALLSDPRHVRRLLLASCVPLLGVGIVASQSRGAALAAFVGLAVVSLTQRKRGKALVWVTAVGLVGVLGLVGVERIAARFGKLSGDLDGGEASRLSMVRDSARMGLDHPWLGVGLGAFQTPFTSYQTFEMPNDRTIVNQAHSDLVQLPTEVGIPAALWFLLCMGVTVRALVRRARETRDPERAHSVRVLLLCLVPAAVHSLYDFPLRVPANGVWAAALLGLAWGAARPESGEHVIRFPKRPVARALVLLPVWVCALAIGWAACRMAQADWTAQPFVERHLPDPRPRKLQRLSYERAQATWPYHRYHAEWLAYTRWRAAMEQRRERARETAERLYDPETTPARLIDQVAETILPQLLQFDTTLRGEAAESLNDLRWANHLAPPRKEWYGTRTEIEAFLDALP